MRRRIRLKWLIMASFLAVSVALIVGYSMLSARSFMRGMDNMIAGNMVQVVKSYVQTVPASERNSVGHFSGYQICRDWSRMPETIRESHRQPEKNQVLYKHEVSGGLFQRPQEFYLYMRVSSPDGSYFICLRLSHGVFPHLVGRNAARNLHMLQVLSLVVVLAVGIVLWIFIKQIERPVGALGRWAKDLDADHLQVPPPDFFYPELNELADLIRRSLSSVQESLEREHRFLRHSSHELRTPIAVIRNNIELLQKLQETKGGEPDPRKRQVVDRIDRASLTMKHLTETLLWLSRETGDMPPETDVDMAELVGELVEDARYLLKDKPVQVTVETLPSTVQTCNIPARIVVGNLIRNAFQHTWEGTVHISQEAGGVMIENDMATEADDGDGDGFGLGLRLVEALTGKLGWAYETETISGRHVVRVCVGEKTGYIIPDNVKSGSETDGHE